MLTEPIACGNKLGGGCKEKFVREKGAQKYCPRCRVDRTWYLKNEPSESERRLVLEEDAAEVVIPIKQEAKVEEIMIPAEPPNKPVPAAKLSLDMSRPQMVVLMDFENVAARFAERQMHVNSKELIDRLRVHLSEVGRISAFTAYADWTRHANDSRSMAGMGVEMIHVPIKSSGSDRSDMAIGLDIMGTLSGPAQIIVLISGDADFEEPIRRAMRAGKYVIVVGGDRTTSGALKNMVDVFYPLENLLPEFNLPFEDETALDPLAAYDVYEVIRAHENWKFDHRPNGKVFLKAFREQGLTQKMWKDKRIPTTNDRFELIKDLQEAEVFQVHSEQHFAYGTPISIITINYESPMVVAALGHKVS